VAGLLQVYTLMNIALGYEPEEEGEEQPAAAAAAASSAAGSSSSSSSQSAAPAVEAEVVQEGDGGDPWARK
jgi:hypothetical protein